MAANGQKDRSGKCNPSQGAAEPKATRSLFSLCDTGERSRRSCCERMPAEGTRGLRDLNCSPNGTNRCCSSRQMASEECTPRRFFHER
ncbi:hypothetical protein GN956_G19087 [Arapaima gigas]